ncbi:MAG: acetate kinase [Campylobacterales bacterium]|nr:acetate kinase [Campylobacterales bacterium]
MKILVINCGSSSIKYKFFDNHKVMKYGTINNVSDYNETLNQIIKSFESIDAVAHRVVHGGEIFTRPTIITPEVCEQIKYLIPLAPLHNPSNLLGIKTVLKLLPNLLQIAVFDTSFHQTMPQRSYMYAIPYEFYEKHHIRKYGFHGSSHEYVANVASKMICKPLNQCNLITIHLGNGSSITAIKNGKSYDTSMGFTPLEGLIMGTRSGDIDPAIIFYLHDSLQIPLKQINEILNKKSGFKGICGISDFIEILNHYNDPKYRLIVDMFIDHIIHYIGGYFLKLEFVDAIVFTGGIGEHSSFIREKISQKLIPLGIYMDKEKNISCHESCFDFHTNTSKVKLLNISTDEEYLIYQKSLDIISK